jgi:hypothetical protein
LRCRHWRVLRNVSAKRWMRSNPRFDLLCGSVVDRASCEFCPAALQDKHLLQRARAVLPVLPRRLANREASYVDDVDLEGWKQLAGLPVLDDAVAVVDDAAVSNPSPWLCPRAIIKSPEVLGLGLVSRLAGRETNAKPPPIASSARPAPTPSSSTSPVAEQPVRLPGRLARPRPDHLVAKIHRTVGYGRSSGATPRVRPLGSARAGSRCGQLWWSAVPNIADQG